MPLAGEFLEKIKYRLRRLGQLNVALEKEIQESHGSIVLYREPYTTKVVDFSRLGFKGHQPTLVENTVQYYFDDISGELFEQFWKQHLESQYYFAAAGSDLLDRTSLQGLPGTKWLTIFWGFDLLTANGMFSLITEDNYSNSVLSLKVHSMRDSQSKAADKFRNELGDLAPKATSLFPSLWNFARLVARSRELQNRKYYEESFTLLMVALESLLSARDAITDTLSRRAGALLAISANLPFAEAVKSVLKLYDARSRFVHQGEPIPSDALASLQDVCTVVFFSALRSQCRWTDSDWREWHQRWFKWLDYIAASFEAGVVVDSGIPQAAGARITGETKISN